MSSFIPCFLFPVHQLGGPAPSSVPDGFRLALAELTAPTAGGVPLGAPSVYHLAAVPLPADLAASPQLGVAWSAAGGPGATPVTLGMAPPPGPPAAVRAEMAEPYHARVTWEAGPAREWEVHRSEPAGFEPGPATLLGRSAWPVWDDVAVEPGKRYEYAVLAVDASGRSGPAARSGAVAVDDAPLPPAPAGLAASPGLGRVTLRWEKVAAPVRGYAVFASGKDGERRISGDIPVAAASFVAAIESPEPLRYTVRAVDRARRLGPPSAAVEAAPLPVPRDPVLVFDGSGLGAATGQQGTLAGKAAVAGGVLDTREGGWLAFPREEILQPGAPLTVSMWVDVDRIEGIPVLISFGHFDGPGWWLQLIGGKIRFYLPVMKILDAGALPPGAARHLAAVYDGRWSRLYVDGKEAGSLEVGAIDPAPWGGELRIGMYSDVDGQFQTRARFGAVKIWRRALPAREVQGEFEKGR